jgi:hypothetical protein
MSQRKGSAFILPPVTTQGVDVLTWRRGQGEARQVFGEGNWTTVYKLLQTWKTDFDNITITRKGGAGTYFRIEAAQGGDDISETYEVHGSSLTQAILANLKVQNAFLSAGATDEAEYTQIAAEITQLVNGFKSGSITEFSTLSERVQEVFPNQAAEDLMFYLLKLGDSFLCAQYTFTHTTCISERLFNQNSLSFAGVYDRVQQIHSSALLQQYENIPAEFVLPPKVSDNASGAEWLKQPPQCNQTSGGKREVVSAYLFADEWSRVPYGVAA